MIKIRIRPNTDRTAWTGRAVIGLEVEGQSQTAVVSELKKLMKLVMNDVGIYQWEIDAAMKEINVDVA